MSEIQTPTNTAQDGSALRRASSTRRLLTVLLDTAFFYAFAFLVGIGIAILGLGQLLTSIPEFVFGVLVYLMYYVPQETYAGRTLGKLVTKTRVVREDGSSISFAQAIGRTLCRFIPFEFLSFLAQGEHGGPRGWHDKIPKTVVVDAR